MTRRLLPPDEWPKLAGTELEHVWPLLNPERARIVVVEDAGQIVGCWAGMLYLHAEGVWTAESHRGRGSVARHLLKGIREIAADFGERAVITGAMSDDVRRLLAHLHAEPLPGDQFVFGV